MHARQHEPFANRFTQFITEATSFSIFAQFLLFHLSTLSPPPVSRFFFRGFASWRSFFSNKKLLFLFLTCPQNRRMGQKIHFPWYGFQLTPSRSGI